MIKWVFSNTRIFIEMVLVAALLIGGWLYNRQKAQIADLTDYSGKLAADLKEQITIKDGEIEILRRDGTKVIRETKYVPREGKTIIRYSTITVYGQNPGATIINQDKGFTFRPGAGLEFGGNGLQGRLDAKWAYYKRYSALAGGTKDGIGVAVSRHLDDILPWPAFNIEAFISYNIIRKSDKTPVSIGVRSNF